MKHFIMFKRIINPKNVIACVLLMSVFTVSYIYLMSISYFRLPLQDLPTVRWCKELRTISEPRNPVGLISAPGSGNIWLRYLLQQATGILTGSILSDYYLYINGFPGEFSRDGSMLVVKNHHCVNKSLALVKFDSIVLLIRKPRDSILASYNIKYASELEFRIFKGKPALTNLHNVVAPPSEYKKVPNDWPYVVNYFLHKWTTLYMDWLTNYHGPIHVVFYENLVNNTRNELQAILGFLNITVSGLDITCAMERQNDLDVIYRRLNKYKYFDPFTKKMYKKMELAKNRVHNLLK